ncbi:putative porin [Runella salmonicolor]|uniref:Porin n=1 Tax=Runella salmonicolor TaxID=2950278 RepID=A0ABT1FJR9_9BACT|nr:putative porin [Runella salmonicolor]MCP1382021.1 putative porin [Runella salmonicolor]
MKKWLYIVFCGFFSVAGYGQIRMPTGGSLGSGQQGGLGQGGQVKIDDSTKVIYGPRTARYFLEEDIFNNHKTLYQIDTSYDDFHRYNFVQRADFQLVDLGNFGTASRNVFFRPIEQLGTQFGYDAYSPYAYQINDVKYYDTKSPYTNLYLTLGGGGQNILRFDHSQNLSPRLNLGMNVQRFTTNKQFGTSGQSDSQTNLAQNWGFVFHGNYRSKDEKYTFLGQFNHLNHHVYEQGGMSPDSLNFKTDRGIEYDNPSATFRTAQSWERRNNWHTYQQYVLAQGFQVYHVFDYKRSIDVFSDTDLTNARLYGFYNNYYYDSTQTRQEVKFRLFENKFGIKGRFQGFNYRAHYRQRIANMNGAYTKSDSTTGTYRLSRFENFVGLWLAYYLKDSTQRATAEFEYLLGRDFKIKGEVVSKWFKVGYLSTFTSPTFVQQLYDANHLRWTNSNRLVNSNNIYGQINVNTKQLRLSPRLDYHLINNYFYYDTAAVARQYTSAFSVVRVGGEAEWRPGKFQFLTQTYYTLVSNNDILRIPRFFANFRATFDFVYAKVLFLQVGGEIHYKSAYYADAYMPLTQQFYLQNRLKTEGVVYTEVFLNARINRVRLFVKMANAAQGNYQGALIRGYFSTPFYPVVGRSLGFGVNWPLFD